MKQDKIKIFVDEIYTSPAKKKYPSNKKVCTHIDEFWSIDLADSSDYKTSNNKGSRYLFKINDNFSKENSKTITEDFSNILSSSKRSPFKIESDRGADVYNSIFPNFLKSRSIHHYSRFTDKGLSIAEGVIRTILNLLKKPVVLAGKADWLSELPSDIGQYNNTVHNSTKKKPIDVSKKSNEKLVYSNLQDKRKILNPKYNLGQPVRELILKK